jgi:hypothetical protein
MKEEGTVEEEIEIETTETTIEIEGGGKTTMQEEVWEVVAG